jgi:oxalate decarboxylase/phosphoglucose isomerase-like protein (cupin superfamily)
MRKNLQFYIYMTENMRKITIFYITPSSLHYIFNTCKDDITLLCFVTRQRSPLFTCNFCKTVYTFSP